MDNEDKNLHFEADKYDDVYAQVLHAKQNDPGMFVSNWEDDNADICAWTKQEIEDDPHKRLITEAENGNLDAVKSILENSSVDINAKDNDGYRALHRACYSNHSDIAAFLISKGADINAVTNMHWTPLHSSVYWNVVSCVRLLLSSGADVNAVTEGSQTPLHLACSKGDIMPEILSLLLATPGIRLDIVNAQGDTSYDLVQRYTPLTHFFYPFLDCCTKLTETKQ